MITSIKMEMTMNEYNEFIDSLNELREYFCKLSADKKSIVFGTKEFSFIKDTIDVLFFTFANVIDVDEKSVNENEIPFPSIESIISNDEAHTAIDALQKAIERTKDLVSKL